MSQKPNFDNTVKKIENISNTVDVIMRNRLIIAFFLIVDGITFILNPDTTLSGMAQNIILLIILAAVSILITNLAAKAKDTKTIAITVLIITLAAFFYFNPDFIAGYLQLLLSLFIIYDGVSNIATVLHWNNKLSKCTNTITTKYHQLTDRKKATKASKVQKEKFKEIDDNINTELEAQGEKLLTPLKKIVNKSRKSSTLYIITNSASVIFGIILLVYPGASMMIWGLIFLYTGFSNLLNGIRSMNLSTKLKEKRFKEILFDAEKKTEKKAKKKTESNSEKTNQQK